MEPYSFGDDVAKWLIVELKKNGFEAEDRPDQVDWGWSFDFTVTGIEHTICLGYRADAVSGDWVGWVERSRGPLGWLLGLGKIGIRAEALQAVHDILAHDNRIKNVRWHRRADFDAGREGNAASSPNDQQ
jgi:hypothetical protein